MDDRILVSEPEKGILQYFSPAYNDYLKKTNIHPSALFVDFYEIDASSQKEHSDLQLKLEEILLSHDMDILDMERFNLSIFEGIQNAKMHSYNFRSGEIVKAHLRITPFDYTATVYSGGSPPNIEKVRVSFNSAQEYAKILEYIRANKIPREEAAKILMPLAEGKRGKGFKNMILSCDWVRFEEESGKSYLTLVKLNRRIMN